jgi:D-aminopeptidase
MAAECLSPEAAQREIYEAAQRAVSRLHDLLEEGGAPLFIQTDQPVTIATELVTSDMADRAAMLPGARRLVGKRIEVTADDMPSAYRAMRAAVSLARA